MSTDWRPGCSFEFSEVLPILDVHLMPVIHPCALEPAIINGKAKRLDQVQPALGRQAESGDISSIRRNLRFNQHNVEHASPKTKKAPQRSRRFFRREGKSISGSVARTQLRRFNRFDIYPAAFTVETYNAVYQSENGVVPT